METVLTILGGMALVYVLYSLVAPFFKPMNASPRRVDVRDLGRNGEDGFVYDVFPSPCSNMNESPYPWR